MNVNQEDPKRGVTILEQITKISKLLGAIPRMEGFISKILLTLSLTENPVQLE